MKQVTESSRLDGLLNVAGVISDSIARELTAAKSLSESEMYTEAGLRLGRCIEASLYSLARASNVDLQDRILPELKSTKDKIKQAEVRILRKSSLNEIQHLAEASKHLSLAIAKLSQSAHSALGESADEPKKLNSLLGELIGALGDSGNSDAARQLREFQPLLGRLTQIRNTAAHASLDGSSREIAADEFQEFAEASGLFIERALQLLVGTQSTRSAE